MIQYIGVKCMDLPLPTPEEPRELDSFIKSIRGSLEEIIWLRFLRMPSLHACIQSMGLHTISLDVPSLLKDMNVGRKRVKFVAGIKPKAPRIRALG